MNPIQRTCYFLIALQMIAYWMAYGLNSNVGFLILAIVATCALLFMTGWFLGERNGRKTQ